MAADTSPPPSVTGVPVRLPAYAGESIHPFSGVTITDVTPGANDIVEIYVQTGDATVSDGPGFGGLKLDISNSALTAYDFSGTPAEVMAEARAVTYTPTRFGRYDDLMFTVTDTLNKHSTLSLLAIDDLQSRGTIAFSPAPTYERGGSFVLNLTASDPTNVVGIEIFASVDGVETDLGPATHSPFAPAGTYAFVDQVAPGTQTGITAVANDDFGGTETASAGFDLTAGVERKLYVASEDALDPTTGQVVSRTLLAADGSVTGGATYASDGSPLTTTRDLVNGTDVVDVLAGGQTLASHSFDTFDDHGQPGNTFVFEPGHGLDIVRSFRGDGADHDVLSFASADFDGSLAELLQNTRPLQGGSCLITDPASGDTVRLSGVSKAQLAANPGDIAFHA